MQALGVGPRGAIAAPLLRLGHLRPRDPVRLQRAPRVTAPRTLENFRHPTRYQPGISLASRGYLGLEPLSLEDHLGVVAVGRAIEPVAT